MIANARKEREENEKNKVEKKRDYERDDGSRQSRKGGKRRR